MSHICDKWAQRAFDHLLAETEKCPRVCDSGALLALWDLLARQAFNASGDEVEESEEVSESAEEV